MQGSGLATLEHGFDPEMFTVSLQYIVYHVCFSADVELTSRTKNLSSLYYFLSTNILVPDTAPVLWIAPLERADPLTPSPSPSGLPTLATNIAPVFIDFQSQAINTAQGNGALILWSGPAVNPPPRLATCEAHHVEVWLAC